MLEHGSWVDRGTRVTVTFQLIGEHESWCISADKGTRVLCASQLIGEHGSCVHLN